MDSNSFKWYKVKNGSVSVAVVDITVENSTSNKNEIVENYHGEAGMSQGYIDSVPQNGFDSWKIAARHGLEYGFSYSKNHWRVQINSIEGRDFIDTNPTIVGYTIFRAFCEKANVNLSAADIEDLDNFVLNSWVKPYKELLPDFFARTFSEYKFENKSE